MNKHLAYINDNYIQIKTKEVLLYYFNSINNSNITNKEEFIKEYKEKIKNRNLINTNIDILLNKDIKEKDIYYYKDIFEDLNYNIINILSTRPYLNNDTLIINKDIYILFHNEKYYYIYPFLLESFIKIKDIKKIKIISNNKLNNNNDCKYYYYANPNNYFIR